MSGGNGVEDGGGGGGGGGDVSVIPKLYLVHLLITVIANSLPV